MSSLQQGSLNFNKSLAFNFKGGNPSSDSGLLLVRSFIEKLGLRPLLQETFNDSINRQHTYASISEQTAVLQHHSCMICAKPMVPALLSGSNPMPH